MTATAGLSRVGRLVVTLVATLAMVASLVFAGMSVGAGTANADPRGYLRPGCEWDDSYPYLLPPKGQMYFVQRCHVWSNAMQKDIVVQIKPAARGGDAGYYLLDGLRARDERNGWFTDYEGGASTFVEDNITLVAPAGGAGSFYQDWQGSARYFPLPPVNYQWETFLTKELPVYLQEHFGVSPTNNAIGGISMGATAAINLASRHPEQFRAALSFSGYLTTTVPGGHTMMALTLLSAGGYNVNAMYGGYLDPRRHEFDPMNIMDGLRNSKVYISAASGVPGPADAGLGPDAQVPGIALEQLSNASTRLYEQKARNTGLNLTTDYPAVGLHNWFEFGSQYQKSRPWVLEALGAY